MGRTNPTYRDAVTALRERWGDFERALRRRDQPAFERLFEHARAHADAAGYLNHEEPLFPLLVSIDLEQETHLDDLDDRLDDLDDRLDDRADDVDDRADDLEERLAATEARLAALEGEAAASSRAEDHRCDRNGEHASEPS